MIREKQEEEKESVCGQEGRAPGPCENSFGISRLFLASCRKAPEIPLRENGFRTFVGSFLFGVLWLPRAVRKQTEEASIKKGKQSKRTSEDEKRSPPASPAPPTSPRATPASNTSTRMTCTSDLDVRAWDEAS